MPWHVSAPCVLGYFDTSDMVRGTHAYAAPDHEALLAYMQARQLREFNEWYLGLGASAGMGAAPPPAPPSNLDALLQRLRQGKHEYERLGVHRRATRHDITLAYRRAALLVHPDKQRCEDAAALFVILQAAHEALLDSARRQAIDAQLGAEDAAQRSRRDDDGAQAWWGRGEVDAAAYWLVHDASIVPPPPPSDRSPRPPPPVRAPQDGPTINVPTDDELQAAIRTAQDCATRRVDSMLQAGGTLVWLYIFVNDRRFAHGWTLYWAQGTRQQASLARVQLAIGAARVRCVQPQHARSIRAAAEAEADIVDWSDLSLECVPSMAAATAEGTFTLEAVRATTLPPAPQIDLPQYITRWLVMLADARARLSVQLWRRLQCVLGGLCTPELTRFAEDLREGIVAYPERTAQGPTSDESTYVREAWFTVGTSARAWQLACAMEAVHE